MKIGLFFYGDDEDEDDDADDNNLIFVYGGSLEYYMSLTYS